MNFYVFMDLKKLTILFLLIGTIGLCHYVSAEEVNGTEWWVLNITNETIDENNVTWGDVSNYTINPNIYNEPELIVKAKMDATLFWAEVQLNTSEIDFGDVVKGNAYVQRYRIKARGTVDIKVTPKLKNPNDDFFSNLKFSSSSAASKYKSINNYDLSFVGLSKNSKNWSVLTATGELRNESGTNKGEQYIKLDLTKFEGIIPFEQPMQNIVVFQITPIWSSVEPMSENEVYHEYIEES